MESVDVKNEKAPQISSKEELAIFIFKWLNLPESDRKESALQIQNEKFKDEIKIDANCNDVQSSTIPSLNKLVEKVWKELKTLNLSVLDFTKKVKLDVIYFLFTIVL